jgi:putative hydrolase of HD superfamily
MEAGEFLEILHIAERLKDTTRHCTTSKGRAESVAEHSWRTTLMAFLLKAEFPELDMDKVVRMCLIHDLGECFTGDIPTFVKTEED